jgi:hypothetical protein
VSKIGRSTWDSRTADVGGLEVDDNDRIGGDEHVVDAEDGSTHIIGS